MPNCWTKLKTFEKELEEQLLLNDYDSTYEDLLEQSGYPNIDLSKYRTLCIEIYKTLNKVNLGYMNDIFKFRSTHRNMENMKCLTENMESLTLPYKNFR